MHFRKRCWCKSVCTVCALSTGLRMCVWVHACHFFFLPWGATGECWECNPSMSDGDSLPKNWSDEGKWKNGGSVYFVDIEPTTYKILHTPWGEKKILQWIIIHLNSSLILFSEVFESFRLFVFSVGWIYGPELWQGGSLKLGYKLIWFNLGVWMSSKEQEVTSDESMLNITKVRRIILEFAT